MPKSSSSPGDAENALHATTPIAISLILFLVMLTPALRAQTLTVLHDFTGGDDGGTPYSGLTKGPGGGFYGTTWSGGYRSSDCVDTGCGTLFQFSRSGSGWDYSVLHTFMSGSDGAGPWARLVFGPAGTLFGTTSAGGDLSQGCTVNGNQGCGTVFRLVPPNQVGPTAVHHGYQAASAPISTVYTFHASDDGGGPGFGDLIFDPAGNIYGTAIGGGSHGWGVVYEISLSGQDWTERALYGFTSGADGGEPYGGVVRDGRGNLYGGNVVGGDGSCEAGICGVIYQLMPSAGGWTDNTIFTFHDFGDTGVGATPVGGLILDSSGNLYGSTLYGGASNGGTVFVMRPQQNGWSLTVLCNLPNVFGGPYASLTMDASGDLYGTTFGDGAYYAGTVFKVTHSQDGWTCNTLHDFTGGNDGGFPASSVNIDAQGNLYGTASTGGAYGQGVIWELTP